MLRSKPFVTILLFLLCLSLLGMFLINCDTKTTTENDDDTNGTNTPHPLVGTWVLTLIKLRIDLSAFGYPSELTPEEAEMTMTITAYADSTFESEITTGEETETGNGTWSTNGNVLTLTYESSDELSGTYSINADTLEYAVTIPYEIEVSPGQFLELDIPVTLVLMRQ